nr:olfactory receptor Olr1107 isoform X2 [Rattus norvegicus]
MAWSNHSSITEFVLTGLSDDPLIQALLFTLFLGIYILTMTGNLMMLLVIGADSHLHTPMYYFLSNLSFVDLCFSTVTVPKLLKDLLSVKKSISIEGCLAQVFFVFFSSGTEACLLSVMAYDRYAAICHPLLYGQQHIWTEKSCQLQKNWKAIRLEKSSRMGNTRIQGAV